MIDPLIFYISLPTNETFTIATLTNFLDKYAFPESNFKVTKFCPINLQRNYFISLKIGNIDWISCVNKILLAKINSSLAHQESVNWDLVGGFKSVMYDSIQDYYLCSSHGGEFYGIKYLIFFHSTKSKNMYALLSPFSIGSWMVAVFSF